MPEWLFGLFAELKITDVLLAAFTAALAVYTAKLFYATKILTQSERPWVGPVTVANAGNELPVGQEMKSCVVIRNTGRTPALEMRVAHDGVILDKGVSPPLPDVNKSVPKALFPNTDDFYYPFGNRILTKAELDAIIHGTRVAWIVARITYLDGAGGEHETHICTRWDQSRGCFVPDLKNHAT